jgi:2-amino-4-hydroxy-6-hydroxymethyldihydropteridine diphosphokinase
MNHFEYRNRSMNSGDGSQSTHRVQVGVKDARQGMIFIGLGSNLPSDAGDPLATCQAALAALPAAGIAVERVSPWYESAPQPPSDQGWFTNAVAAVATALSPPELMTVLHRIETRFARARTIPNAARTLDLDLLAYGDIVMGGPLTLPHPRMAERAFVLAPLHDLAPEWRHPVLGQSAAMLLAQLPRQPLRQRHNP